MIPHCPRDGLVICGAEALSEMDDQMACSACQKRRAAIVGAVKKAAGKLIIISGKKPAK